MKNLILLVIITISTIGNSQTRLPDLKLKNLKGEEVNLSEISEDKTVVVSLWATWCVPCIRELDTIAETYEDLQEEMGFELIAISLDDARSTRRVKPAVMGKGWEYQVLLDPNNDLKRYLGVSTIPFTLIVKNGEIKFRHSSFNPGAEDALFEEFKQISTTD
ncbi:MAG: TlpA disulfide reductase family protein [Nonlabens sp.]